MWFSFRQLMLFSILIYSMGTAMAGPTFHDYSQYTHWDKTFGSPTDEVTSVVNCEIMGQAYLATTSQINGLTFYSSVDNEMLEIGRLQMTGSEQSVAFDGGFAYVVSRTKRLIKVVAHAPSSPSIQWTDMLPYDPVDVDILGQYLIISCGLNGILVYDRTENFTYPVGLVAQWYGTADEVLLKDDIAVVSTSEGIVTLDLSDPLNPVELDSFPLISPHSLALDGDLLYAGYRYEVAELDITNPGDIEISRTFSDIGAGSYNHAMCLTPEGLFLASNATLQLLDLDSGTFTWVGWGANGAHAMGYLENHLGIGTDGYGFQTLALKSTEFAPSTEIFTLPNTLGDMQIDGDLLLGSSGSDLQCYNLNNFPPSLSWSFDTTTYPEYVDQFLVDQGRAFIGYTTGRIVIIEYASDHWTERASFETENSEIINFALIGNHLVVFLDPEPGTGRHGLIQIYNLDDISSPELVSSYSNNDFLKMNAYGTTVVLSDHSSAGNGVLLLDAADPANIIEASTISTQEYAQVYLSGDVLYLIESISLVPLDISNPYSPIRGQETSIPHSSQLKIHGNTGYISGKELVYDLSNPMWPDLIGSSTNAFMTQNNPYLQQPRIAALGHGYLIVSRGSDLSIMGEYQWAPTAVDHQPTPLAEHFFMRAAPNPFNPQVMISFALPQSAQTEITIYDLKGSLVKVLKSELMSAGPHEVLWNGKNQSGKQVASGVYMAQLSAGAKTQTQKLMLVK